jgi:transposase
MSKGVRVIGPDRAQLRWEMVDLDSQLPDDHRARLVWAFVQGLDLGEFYDRIKARDEVAGRPATDPQVVLAVWLYATMEAIGSARAIDRLCQQHAAYRWLCGGAPINHDLLSTFRRENAAILDRLLTQSLTGLIAEKLVTLEELMIDGTKARARAGRGSMSKRKRLESIEKAVAERVAALKGELDKDPAEPERRRKQRALQAAEERARRVERAHQKLAGLAKKQAERAKRHAKQEAEKGEPKVSVSDPEARLMRLADGATAPAWNVQVATANGFIVAIDPTDRRNDGGLAPGLVETVAERCGRVPQRLLADTRAMPQEDIVKLGERYPSMTVYSPPAPERTDVSAETLRKRLWRRRHEAGGPGVAGANGQRGGPRNLPPAQADRTGAWHHQKPRHVALPGAWPRNSPRGLPAAGTGAQPWLGAYAAAPYRRGRGTASAGNRMIAIARKAAPSRCDIHRNVLQSVSNTPAAAKYP